MILFGLPENLPDICDISLVKIRCAYAAYKDFDKIAQFYHGKDQQDNITSVIGKIGSYISLWTNGSNLSELKSFLDFLGYSGIFTSLETAKLLKFKINQECLVFKIKPPYEEQKSLTKESPRRLAEILKQGLEIDDTNEFIADVSFRVSHSCGDYVTNENCGGLLYFDQKDALINGICTDPLKRGKGFGSLTIKHLLAIAKNRNVYACCSYENKEFYIKNGFSLIGKAAYCEE